MAIVFEDHIQCDDSDPILAIRMPQDLLDWVEDSANIRGISIEELVNETLFDHFCHRSGSKLGNGGRGSLKLNPRELRLREDLRKFRYVRLQALPRKKLNTLVDKFDWDKFYEIRKHNIAALELDGYKPKRVQLYDPQDIEELRIELEKRGIKRDQISLDGLRIKLSRGSTPKYGKDKTPLPGALDPSQPCYPPKGAPVPKPVMNPRFAKALKDIDAETGVVTRIRAKRDERRAELAKNNPTD